jgi:hypothetical protein
MVLFTIPNPVEIPVLYRYPNAYLYRYLQDYLPMYVCYLKKNSKNVKKITSPKFPVYGQVYPLIPEETNARAHLYIIQVSTGLHTHVCMLVKKFQKNV